MKKIAIVLACVFLFSGCALLKDLQKALNPKEDIIKEHSILLDDVELKADIGSFRLSSIDLFQDDYAKSFIEGVITNNTGKTWLKATISANLAGVGNYELYDTPISKNDKVNFKIVLKNQEDYLEKKDVSFSFVGGDYLIEYDFSMIKPTANKNLRHSDNNIDISFNIDAENVFLEVANKTQNPIKLDWTNFSYVDTESRAHRLIHTNVRLIDAEKQQASTLIPPFAKIKETVYPSDYIDNKSSGWEYKPLFPIKSTDKKTNLTGKLFSFFMPIEINGVVKNYNFVFKITGEK